MEVSLRILTILSDVSIFLSLVGLAGMATAHALALSGHRVRVFEQSQDPTLPCSSAFRLPPNGTKIIERWGIWDELVKRGSKLTGCKFLDRESPFLTTCSAFPARHMSTPEYSEDRRRSWISSVAR